MSMESSCQVQLSCIHIHRGAIQFAIHLKSHPISTRNTVVLTWKNVQQNKGDPYLLPFGPLSGTNEVLVWKKPRQCTNYGWIEHSFHHYHHSQLHHLLLIYPYSLHRHNDWCNNYQDVHIDHEGGQLPWDTINNISCPSSILSLSNASILSCICLNCSCLLKLDLIYSTGVCNTMPLVNTLKHVA